MYRSFVSSDRLEMLTYIVTRIDYPHEIDASRIRDFPLFVCILVTLHCLYMQLHFASPALTQKRHCMLCYVHCSMSDVSTVKNGYDSVHSV